MTHLVTTAPVSARLSATTSDCRNALTCEKQTQPDHPGREFSAWHAGQRLQSRRVLTGNEHAEADYDRLALRKPRFADGRRSFTAVLRYSSLCDFLAERHMLIAA